VLLLLFQLLWAVVSSMVGFMGKKERAVRTAQFWGSHQRFFRWGLRARNSRNTPVASYQSCATPCVWIGVCNLVLLAVMCSALVLIIIDI
jgi:hypothetical protein